MENDKKLAEILDYCRKYEGPLVFDLLQDLARIVQSHENELNGPLTMNSRQAPVGVPASGSKKPFDVSECAAEVMREWHIGDISQKDAFERAVQRGYDAAKNGR